MALRIEKNVVTGISLDKGITDVVIPDGITAIGRTAFNMCSEMTSLTIPDSVTKIGITAFVCCRGLTVLRIPDSVTEIGDKAFWGCENIVTNLSIKQWDKKYGLEKLDYALNYMRQYQSGDPFFDNVKAENDKYIRSQRSKLFRKATADDGAVISYMLQATRLTVDDIDYLLEKFSENVEITALLLDYKNNNFTDEYLAQLETERFEKEVGIKERTLADWKKFYMLGEDTGEGGYTLMRYKGTDTEIIIPDHIAGKPVTRIGSRCFSPNGTKCSDIRQTREKIQSIYIPDTVTCIEWGAFQCCTSLAEITIPDSVVDIGNYAFNECSSLTEVTLPESLITISNGLFSCCRSLDHIQIPKSVTHIGDSAFRACSKLTEIDIPDSVARIEIGAFTGCYALKKVTLPKGLKTINQFMFSMCKSLTEIEIPESVTLIQRNAFYGNFSLTEITLPKNITSVEFSTFGCCKSLKKVNLPEGLARIEDSAFSVCSSLHEITIPASVTFIDYGSFNNTNDLVITAPRGSYAIGYAKEHSLSFKEI